MIRALLLLFLLNTSCTSSPVKKELRYKGENLSKLGDFGLLVGYLSIPIDTFPFDRRSAVIYFENSSTKEEYFFGETKGVFYLKLPPGDYTVKDIWAAGKCNPSTGHSLSGFFDTLPKRVQKQRARIEAPVKSVFTFRIAKGKMTDLGSILMTCLEWDGSQKFIFEFSDFIEDGKFEVFKTLKSDEEECGCKLLRKKDGNSIKEMKKDLN
jgi:hypothetical protein